MKCSSYQFFLKAFKLPFLLYIWKVYGLIVMFYLISIHFNKNLTTIYVKWMLNYTIFSSHFFVFQKTLLA